MSSDGPTSYDKEVKEGLILLLTKKQAKLIELLGAKKPDVDKINETKTEIGQIHSDLNYQENEEVVIDQQVSKTSYKYQEQLIDLHIKKEEHRMKEEEHRMKMRNDIIDLRFKSGAGICLCILFCISLYWISVGQIHGIYFLSVITAFFGVMFVRNFIIKYQLGKNSIDIEMNQKK